MNWKPVFETLPLTERERVIVDSFLKDPSSIRFLGVSKILTKYGKESECLAMLQSGLKHHPHYSAGLIYLSQRLYYCGFISDAMTRLKEIPNKDTLSNSLAIELKAKVCAISERHSELNEWLHLGLQSFPKHPFFTLAWEKLHLEGLVELKQFILDQDFTPRNVSPLIRQGASHQKMAAKNPSLQSNFIPTTALVNCRQYDLKSVVSTLCQETYHSKNKSEERGSRRQVYENILLKLNQIN